MKKSVAAARVLFPQQDLPEGDFRAGTTSGPARGIAEFARRRLLHSGGKHTGIQEGDCLIELEAVKFPSMIPDSPMTLLRDGVTIRLSSRIAGGV